MEYLHLLLWVVLYLGSVSLASLCVYFFVEKKSKRYAKCRNELTADKCFRDPSVPEEVWWQEHRQTCDDPDKHIVYINEALRWRDAWESMLIQKLSETVCKMVKEKDKRKIDTETMKAAIKKVVEEEARSLKNS